MGQFFHAVTAPTGGDPTHVRKSRLPIGQSYVPHEGRQAKLRRLRQRTRTLPVSAEQAFRVNVYLKTAPQLQDVKIDEARMIVLNHARCRAEELDLPFSDCLDAVLDKLEREASEGVTAALLAPTAVANEPALVAGGAQ